ncbi:hypothetical protein [Adhaeribacter aquaticus]|uniref:hypothetical protein n=1 Tax=Adhaeribacter aquaticus TaxID=299567 RepID=UPI00047D6779|nr:hypothetical protein [Adhaeribacter aquaticus]
MDVRGRGRSEKEDHDWYFQEFLPFLFNQVNKNYYLAYLVTPTYYNLLEKEGLLTKLATALQHDPVQSKFFLSEPEAINWLRSVKS